MSWTTCLLSDVLVKTENINPTKEPNRVFQYVDVSSVSKETLKIVETQNLLGKEAPSRARKLIKEGDVLFATVRPTLRRIAIVPNELNGEVCSTGYFVLRSNGKLLQKFIFYYFLRNEFMEIMENIQTGASYPAVTDKQILEQAISYPSLATQQKIVEKLDLIFFEVERATMATEANVKNAELLYRSSVNQVFETFKEKEVRLKNISCINYGYTAKSSLENDGYHYLRITDIQENFVEWMKVPKVNVETSEIQKYILKDGDIVFARTGATTGKSYLVKDAPNAIFASYLIRVDVKRSEILPAYIKHYFNSEEYWANVNAGISGAAQGGFNASKLGELLIPYVSLERQNLVVKELSTLERRVNEMKNNYFSKLTDFNLLRNSILKQAFSGELVKE